MWPFKKSSRLRHSASSRQARPWLEALESRLVPYALTGDAWIHPELLTISFVPDGTIIGSNTNGYIRSNLFAQFNSHPGWTTATWENQILKAAQAWAQQTNVNFTVVSDNGATSGTGNYQQGDPGFGDIRIAGYDFGNSYLAVADMPAPDNNYSIAGDVTFNTGQPFNIGSTYDLFSVATHEIGHATGLDHSSSASAVMYGTYVSTRTGLNSDDVAGIRSIYSNNSGRTPDAYNVNGSNGSFATAADISSQIGTPSLTAVVNNLDITSTSTREYFTFTAPAGTSNTLTVKVQSSGLSLLAPNLTVYAADQTTVLGSASGLRQYGTTLTVTLNGVSAGQSFYVKVAGADTTAFGTGKYALILNLGTGATPTAAPPNTQTADGSTLHSGGGQNQTGTLVGWALGTVGSVTNGLLGTLLGISTSMGIGAGVGDAISASGDDSGLPALQPAVDPGVSVTLPATQKPSMASGRQTPDIGQLPARSGNLQFFTGLANPDTLHNPSFTLPLALVPFGPGGQALVPWHPGKANDPTATNGDGVENASAEVATEERAEVLPAAKNEPSHGTDALPAPAAQPAASQKGWAEMSTAAFTDGRSTPDAPEVAAQGLAFSSLRGDGQGPDLLAVGAGLALVLGAFWGSRAHDSQDRKAGSGLELLPVRVPGK